VQSVTITPEESAARPLPEPERSEGEIEQLARHPGRIKALLEDRFGFSASLESNVRLSAALRYSASTAGIAVSVVGALVLIGWLLDLAMLKRISPPFLPMEANAALAFVLSGVALHQLSAVNTLRWRRVLAQACAFFVALIGVLTLSESLYGWHLGIDQLLFTQPVADGALDPGRMAPASALHFALIGVALLIMDFRRTYPLAQLLALIACMASLLVLVGYIYGEASIYSTTTYTRMSLHTSAGFVALCAGVLLARQDRGILVILTSDAAGGEMARRLLPAAFVMPLLLGSVVLAGERARLYETGFLLSVMVMATIASFATLIWWNSGSLYRLDAERRRAVEALKKGQAQLNDAQRIAHVGSADWDIPTNAITWSDELYRILGLEPQEVAASNEAFLERVHHEDRDSVRQIIDGARLASEPFSLDYRVLRPDGTPRLLHGEGTVVCHEDGEPVRVTTTAQDVTERKRIEYALRKSEERTRSIIANANDAFIAIDQGGRITDWNQQADATFGWSGVEAIGQTLADLVLPERDREQHRESLHRFLTTGEGPVLNTRIEILALHRDGHEFPVEVTMSVVGSGRSYMFSAFLRDITERKNAEESLAKHAQDLARINAELEDFTHSVSHDLKEPLRGIEAFAGFLAEDYGDKLDEQGQRYVGVLRDSAVRMKDLIDDLLQLSRIGRTAVEYVQIPMRAMIEDIGLDLGFAIQEKNVDLRVDPNLPTIACDKVRLREVFKNLISNAVKYNDKPQPVVEISCRQENGLYTFSVKDNGIGIDEQYHEKIFRIFQRLHRREEYEGTGVGLTICKKVIEAHGGTIWVESTAGEGTTFLFTIPKSPVGSQPSKEKVA
jgi:PAS domain S-box-containing protein